MGSAESLLSAYHHDPPASVAPHTPVSNGRAVSLGRGFRLLGNHLPIPLLLGTALPVPLTLQYSKYIKQARPVFVQDTLKVVVCCLKNTSLHLSWSHITGIRITLLRAPNQSKNSDFPSLRCCNKVCGKRNVILCNLDFLYKIIGVWCLFEFLPYYMSNTTETSFSSDSNT